MRDALPSLAAGLDGDPRNVLLTLARMWRTVATGDECPIVTPWRTKFLLLAAVRSRDHEKLGQFPHEAVHGVRPTSR